MITKEIEWILNIALSEASGRQHNYLLVEHLLLAICESEVGKDFLTQCEVDTNEITEELRNFLDQQRAMGKEVKPTTSLMVERIVKRAVEQALLSEKEQCTITDIVIAMMKEDDSYAVSLLKKNNLTRLRMMSVVKNFEHHIDKDDSENKKTDFYDNQERKIFRFVRERLSKDVPPMTDYRSIEKSNNINDSNKFSSKQNTESEGQTTSKRRGNFSEEKILQEFLIDLNEKARKKQIDPLIGRADEMHQMLLILGRRKKNNPILVGDPGVGKTAMVEGLALAIIDKTINEKFYEYQVYSLELGSILAGTKFRGDFEERLTRIFSILKKKTKCIVFIDEIHTLVGAGATTGSGVDASNLIKPLLMNEEVLIIGATTFQEYRNHFQKDLALNRRFEKTTIKEPSEDETILILERLVPYYERYHGVKYPMDLIKTIPKLCNEYFLEKNLPDGAIDILDLAGSMTKLQIQKKSNRKSTNSIVNIKDVTKLVAKVSGRPLKQIEEKNHFNFNTLIRNIKKEIFGQDHVVEQVLKAVKLSKLGIVDGERPIGAFLFVGPTGVGKTELCRALSKLLSMHLIRLDMSEFIEAHSVAKLIGAPPGYVGYNERKGELTEQVRKFPQSLVLLDEIEKAHPDVVNAFLQVMDYGKLTDSTGDKISFKSTLIIMTSNLGAEEMLGNALGFNGRGDEKKIRQGKVEEPVKNFFRPEFRNRLSAIINFNFLDERIARQIIDKLVREINTQLSEKQIQIIIEDSAVDLLLQRYDKKMGGRSIKRVFEREIKEKIADFIFGNTTQFFTKKSQNHFTKITFYLDKRILNKTTKTKQTKKQNYSSVVKSELKVRIN